LYYALSSLIPLDTDSTTSAAERDAHARFLTPSTMSGRRVPMGVVALTSLLTACTACAPSGRDGSRPQKEATTVNADRWEVRSVPIPDLSRLPESVQTQVRDRYAALAEKAASPRTPPQEL